MPITQFGAVAVPVDGAAATNATTQITITPPGSMVVGDLVLVYMHQRGTATFSVGVNGGQTWNALTRRTNTNIAVQAFWCRYNGTWGANPRFDFSAGTCTSAIMLVFRPSASGYSWAIDQAEASATFAAPTTPFTVTRTGVTNAQSSTVSVAGFFTADDNTWTTLSGAGWSQTGITAQYRNTAGTDQSAAFAYRIAGSGASGNVSLNQATLGGDLGLTTIVSFYEIASTTYNDSLSEAAVPAATESGAASIPVSVAEPVTPGNTEAAVLTFNASQSEAITPADDLSSIGIFGVSHGEPVTPADEIAGGMVLAAAASEAITPGDSSTAAIVMAASISDSIALEDAAIVLAIFTGALSDEILAQFTTDGSVSAGNVTYNDSLSEALAPAFASSNSADLGATLAEALAAAFELESTVAYYETLAEAFAGEDLSEASIEMAATISEDATLVVVQELAGNQPTAFVYTSSGWVACSVKTFRGTWQGQLKIYRDGAWIDVV